MRFFLLTISFCCISILSVGQNKEMIADTSSYYYYKSNKKLIKKLGLKNLETSKEQSIFRFGNHGQLIEIIDEGETIQGQLVNFIYHQKQNGKKEDTLFKSTKLEEIQIEQILSLVDSLDIHAIPTDDEIEDWRQGLDGITYLIEYATPNTYSFKSYWTPKSQKDFDESIRIRTLINRIDSIAQMSESRKLFKETLPHRGCYTTNGSLIHCYISPGINIEYTGVSKLPLGAAMGLYTGSIGQMSISGHARFNNNKDHDYGYRFSRSFKINGLRNNRILANYQYRNRELSFIEDENTFNHKFLIAFDFKKQDIQFIGGIDYLHSETKQTAPILGMAKGFTKPELYFYSRASFFEDKVDYETGISKSIEYSTPNGYSNMYIGIFNESFRGYNDVGVSVTLPLDLLNIR